ncbi:hypothetical protein Plhal304r1_c027g0089821 [Plasmopara halstedii]
MLRIFTTASPRLNGYFLLKLVCIDWSLVIIVDMLCFLLITIWPICHPAYFYRPILFFNIQVRATCSWTSRYKSYKCTILPISFLMD